MTIWDTSGNERFRSLRKKYYTNWDVIIYVFDLSKRDTIDKSLLTEAKRISGPNKNLIYLLGNKLDISMEYLEEYRKKVKILIDNGVIDKYFEVSAKTGEGIKQFFKALKIILF